MPRRNLGQIVDAAHELLADRERVIEYGPCWAAPLRAGVPLLLVARRQLLMVLTDRRLLLVAHWRRGLRPRDLVIGKRYDAFTLLELHKARPLLQLLVELSPGAQMVLEFRPRRRRLGELLAHRLDPSVRPPDGTSSRADGTDDAGFWDTPTPAS